MAKEKFTDHRFSAEKEVLVQWAEKVTEEYKAQGYEMSLRQLYYVGVTENLYRNKQSNYNMLVELVTNARMSGRIDWHSIVDRNRTTNDFHYFGSLSESVSDAAKRFKLDKWLAQPNYVEVMVEKAALEGVIQRPCGLHQVPFTASRGYPSSTLMYDMAHRMRERHCVGKKSCHVIYCGDHDPSGIDIDRDIKDRLNIMSMVPVHVHRIALNMGQIEQYKCPPNPVKFSDSRADDYKRKYGISSWELDALEPSILGDLVGDSIEMLKDETIWKKECSREMDLKERYQDILEELEEQGD